MAEKKGAKPVEKKGAIERATDAVKGAAKAVADVMKHPVDSAMNAAKAGADGAKSAAKAGAAKAVKAVGEAVGVQVKPARKIATNVRGRQRVLQGIVRSDKMDKTVIVEVISLKRDPFYGKYLKDRERYKAHDEKNQYKTGDRVEISAHRPLSREKRWAVTKLLDAAKVE